jgi:hypothetical protein
MGAEMTYTGTYTAPFWPCTCTHPARPARLPLKTPTRVPTRPTRAGTYTLPGGSIYPPAAGPTVDTRSTTTSNIREVGWFTSEEQQRRYERDQAKTQ